LIVAHHDSFKDGGAALIELIEKIGSLNCCLRWRPLGEVIRRACRRRANAAGSEDVEMYSNELLINNPSDQPIKVKVRWKKNQDDLVSKILCDEKPVTWATEVEQLVFGERIPSCSEKRFRVVCQEQAYAGKVRRSLRFELSVAARRFLSELRDQYLSRSRFLSVPADRLRSVLRKAI
jgi:hypothetical protein